MKFNFKELFKYIGRNFYIIVTPISSLLWICVSLYILKSYDVCFSLYQNIIMVFGSWIGLSYFKYKELKKLDCDSSQEVKKND